MTGESGVQKLWSVGYTLLIDGYNLAFRAFYGMPELTRSDGFPTNAIHGWLRTIWMLQDQHQPDRMIAFFDLGHSVERSALQADYKANRKETPEALEKQVPYLKALTRALGILLIEREGVEADDMMAAAALRLKADGERVGLVSADKDLGQIIQPGITQLLPPPTANPRVGWREIDEAGVREKFKVRPDQIPDFLALVGDSSDNIAGLAGCGPKTAAKWLEDYGSLERILAQANYLMPARFQQKVAESRDLLLRNLKMVTLDTEQTVPWLDAPSPVPDPVEVVRLLNELEMKRAARDAAGRLDPGCKDAS